MYITTVRLLDTEFEAGIDTGATKTVLPSKLSYLTKTKPAVIRTADGKHEARVATQVLNLDIDGYIYTTIPIFFRDRALLGLDILQSPNSDWTMDRAGVFF